jgi:protein-disulfide isomerase
MSTATPSRKERRDEARRERVERERAEAAAAARRRRLTRLGAVLAAAAIVVAILVAVSGPGRDATPTTASSSTAAAGVAAGAAATNELLAGVPQNGTRLGDPSAPVRVVEFADLQCPFCAEFSERVLPQVVRDYVRPGEVRMEFRGLAFIGPDSERAARVVEAAGRQDRLWNVLGAFYANQGRENSGYATDAFLRRIVGAVPGLDAGRVFAERGSAAVTRQLSAAQELATSSGVQSTPTFLVGRGSDLKAVDAAGLPAAIEEALGR